MRDSPRSTAGRQQIFYSVLAKQRHFNGVGYHRAHEVFKLLVLHNPAMLVVFYERLRSYVVAPFFFADVCGADRQRLLLQSVIDKVFRSSEISRGHLNRHAAVNREDFFFCRLWFQNSRHKYSSFPFDIVFKNLYTENKKVS